MQPRRLRGFAILSSLSIVMVAGPSQAATFIETEDAGEQLDNAIPIFTDQGQVMPLDSISGVLAGDADLFKIFLTGGQQFSATTINAETLLEIPINNTIGSPSDLLADPQLFLFDAVGNGVLANDDSFGSSQSTLPSLSLSPTESGIYFLAISGFDTDPISNEGEIFPDESNGVFGPAGPGGNSPLIGFSGPSTSSGRYTIALTGAQTLERPASVPEPSSALGLITLAALGLGSQVNKLSVRKIVK